MKHIKTIILLVFLCSFTNAKAQLSTNEQPVSFGAKLDLKVTSQSAIPVVILPQLDMTKISKEEGENDGYDKPFRFGYPHKVNYDLNNSGTWFEMTNGDKLWQLNVVCPGALSVNFCYDKFWIPEGGKFFVYSKDKKHTIGAFTSRNNKGDRDNPRGFATGLVYGDDVVLEYYQPKEITTNAIISIKNVIHGYRYINNSKSGFNSAGDCMVNINCEEGQNWQIEKKAVARIIMRGYNYSGSLINTTNLSEEPFLLTANHCVDYFNKDALDDSILDDCIFYWNYEAPGCLYNIEPDSISTSGAIVVANNEVSDFALLYLTEDPKTLSNYTPYYLGWNRSGLSGSPGVCIHHPKGDVKKISTVLSQPISTFNQNYSEYSDGNHWRVLWATTQLGRHSTTEPGSSGSPLLTAEHKVIGQLHGGNSDCGDSISAPDWYGKFDVSWTGNNNSSIYRRLNCWLDSLNAGVQKMEGLLIITSASIMNTAQQLYSNIRIKSSGQLTIQNNVELKGNSRVIVESGGILIINGGTLSNADIQLKPGSTLRIINGGIIETRNGFEAPIGVVVDIVSGQIL